MIAPISRSVHLITHEFFPIRGGIATFAEEMARACSTLGYPIEVWAQAAADAEEKVWPFPMRRLPLKGSQDFSCQVRLARELIRNRRRLRKGTVYLPEPGAMLSMMYLHVFKAFAPGRLVLTFHGSEILKFHATPWRRLLTRRLIGRADRISTLTHYTHRLLIERFPEAVTKTFLTPGALRSDFRADKPRPRRTHGNVVVLTVGRLHPRKGQLFILEALQSLPSEYRKQIEYWLVGGGNKEGYGDRLARAARESDFPVRFLGNVGDDELDRIYDSADIFAMTSINHKTSVEGFGLVYLEAAAHGLPVVAHSVGGVPEAVIQEETGILVPPGDRPALAAAFQRLICEPELRRRLGDTGRSWAQNNCWKRSAELLFNTADLTIAG